MNKVKRLSSLVAAVATIATGSIGMSAVSFLTSEAPPAQAASCSFSGRAMFQVNVRADKNTSSRVVKALNVGTYQFSGYEMGQAVNDAWTNQSDSRWFKLSDGSGWVASAVINGNPPSNCPDTQSAWRLPWRAGVTANLSQGWHYDGWNKNSNGLDFAVPAGTPVLAPRKSTVVNFCNAGGNHLAIQLKAEDGSIYSLDHVNSTSVFQNKTFNQGEMIGTVASNRPWNNCAQSTGPHIHFGLPSQNIQIDGYNFSPSSIPRSLTSKNN